MNLPACLSVWKKIDCSPLLSLFQVVIKLSLEENWPWSCLELWDWEKVWRLFIKTGLHPSSSWETSDVKEVVWEVEWHFFSLDEWLFLFWSYENAVIPIFSNFLEKSKKGRKRETGVSCFFWWKSWQTTCSKWRQWRKECFCLFVVLNRSQWVKWLLCWRAQQLGSVGGRSLWRGRCSQGTGTYHWLHLWKWEKGLARSTGHDSYGWTWISAYGPGKLRFSGPLFFCVQQGYNNCNSFKSFEAEEN